MTIFGMNWMLSIVLYPNLYCTAQESLGQWALRPLKALASAVASTALLVLSPLISLHHFLRPVNPVTRQREFHLIPTSFENFMGQISYPSLVMRSGGRIFEDHPTCGHYAKLVADVGAELVAKCPRQGLQFEFTLIDSPVVNAWCLPGGKIGINVGMIQKMDQELDSFGLKNNFSLRQKVAAVLSHEITHAAARHGGRRIEFGLFLTAILQTVKYAIAFCFVSRGFDKEIQDAGADSARSADVKKRQKEAVNNSLFVFGRLSDWLSSGLTLCGSRSHELEADKYGMHLMKKVDDLNPEAAVWLMRFLDKYCSVKTGIGWYDRISNWFHTHPTSEERLRANKRTLQELNADSSLRS